MLSADVSTSASAQGDPLLGALIGGGIGAAIGHSVNGSNGAWVGGALGAVTGASVAASAGGYYNNGYYDNAGRRVEGKGVDGRLRMTLSGQVYPVMAGVADEKRVKAIVASVNKHLRDPKLGGVRLNTDFGASQPDLGRAPHLL